MIHPAALGVAVAVALTPLALFPPALPARSTTAPAAATSRPAPPALRDERAIRQTSGDREIVGTVGQPLTFTTTGYAKDMLYVYSGDSEIFVSGMIEDILTSPSAPAFITNVAPAANGGVEITWRFASPQASFSGGSVGISRNGGGEVDWDRVTLAP